MKRNKDSQGKRWVDRYTKHTESFTLEEEHVRKNTKNSNNTNKCEDSEKWEDQRTFCSRHSLEWWVWVIFTRADIKRIFRKANYAFSSSPSWLIHLISLPCLLLQRMIKLNTRFPRIHCCNVSSAGILQEHCFFLTKMKRQLSLPLLPPSSISIFFPERQYIGQSFCS